MEVEQAHETRQTGLEEAYVPITVNMLITQDITKDQPFVIPKSLELMSRI